MPTVSGFYPTQIVGHLRPPAQVLQWNIDGISPSGLRHHESGVYKPYSKLGLRGGFTAQKESGTALNLGTVYADDAGFYSNTACITFNLGEVNNNPASYFDAARSEIGTNFKAFNLRLWINTWSAFPSGIPIIYYFTSAAWRRAFKLTSDTVGALPLPSSLPASKNWPTNSVNEVFISGCHKETEFSHFMYLVAKFPAASYSLGTYGGLGEGTFEFRVSYDWTDIDANVLATDL